MVSEGAIEEEKLHSFNIPQYTPSPAEVRRSEGSFAISRLETSEIRWADCGSSGGGEDVAKCMRSVAEHFGETIIDELFKKYERCLTDCMSEEEMKFINVTVSLIRRG
ncbi:hypothetical protein SASPL_125960 [Salvia splendens]|uniref:Jasmonate O-methyltransferase n=1 Tax=Salvia splendens TaxID=180675 RepID=A0A8X8ZPL4_SALSN|nr:hypothetical protein SASPL_125960 [Salvia splendens]